ncbi:MAG: hypothetical protein RID07_15850, partial [Lacipirellulaceae bacterium]
LEKGWLGPIIVDERGLVFEGDFCPICAREIGIQNVLAYRVPALEALEILGLLLVYWRDHCGSSSSQEPSPEGGDE